MNRKLFNAWLKNREVSPATERAYNESLDLFEPFVKDDEPTQEEVLLFMAQLRDRGKSSRTRARHLAAIKKYFFIKQRQLFIETPRIKKTKPNYPSQSQVLEMIKNAPSLRDQAALAVMYWTGVRVGGLVSMERSRYNASNKSIVYVSKGGDERWLPLAKPAYQILDDYLKGRTDKDHRLFPTTETAIRSMVYRLCRALKFPRFSPHSLRHAINTHMAEAGVPHAFRQALLGHHQSQTTDLYTHVSEKELRKKVEEFAGTR